jgi:RNA polymerase sigma-70 factor (ECF subfamily)
MQESDKRPVFEEHEDELLVKQVLRGESGSFDILVRRYQSVVYATAYRFVKSREDALDVAQDAFIKAFRSLYTWQPTAPFRAWLLRIAVNMSIDYLRRRKRTPQAVDPEELMVLEYGGAERHSHVEEPSDRASDSELGTLIRAAADTLPERQKMVFILRHYQGLPLKEIAEIMNCTEGTVKTHLFRAVGKLRDELRGVRRDFMRG